MLHFMLVASIVESVNVTVLASVHPSVCPDGILTMTYRKAAYDAASVHFFPTIRRTNILVCDVMLCAAG